jgi:hypothetical protein
MCCYKRNTQVFIVFHVNLKSDFAYGQVVVGVRPTLPVQDISSLFGIDVAGGKVIMDPIISEEASYAENELEHRVVFPACAITLATKKPLAEEDALLQCGIIEASDVELKDNFVY